MMTTDLARTPLHDWHVAHGGRMVDFAGWSMPVQYSSIADEHNATRNAVGVFDISHMGRLGIRGTNALTFLDAILTRRVTNLQLYQIRYSLICNEIGGILDDVLVYGLEDAVYPVLHGPTYAMVVNASNREKIVSWLNSRAASAQVRILDDTTGTAMIAVQGPKAIDLVQPLVSTNVSIRGLKYYTYTTGDWNVGRVNDVLVSRTGYTGEDGVEIICLADGATTIWQQILDAAQPVGGMAAGLGARDTLRLEAAMPLYGHELSETINPIQAGLNFAMNLEGREFMGSNALKKIVQDKSQPVRVGLELDGQRVPRQGCAVLHNNEIVGEVTSGTFSPTLQRPIAMAYVQPTAQSVGTQLAVDIRGTQYPAAVVPLPFYQRKKN
jgi:aminomethyltransferase